MSKSFHVLMYLKWYHPKVQSGISRFAQQAGWHLNTMAVQYTQWKPTDYNGWRGDGIIASGEPEVLERDLSQLKDVPTFFFGSKECPERFYVVDHDEEALDKKAFHYFRQQGYFRFLVVGSPHKKRGQHFIEMAESRGYDCERVRIFEDFPHPWENVSKRMVRRLHDMQFPLAVYALTDELAAGMIEAATGAGIRVPEDVAVLGVHNDNFICNMVRPSLSSVDNDLEGMGYEAARNLHAVMNGEPAPRRIIIPPQDVVVRESTLSVGFKSEPLRIGIRYIRENFLRPISLEDIAKASGVCKRHLGALMKEEMGTTIHQELLRLRINHAKDLLANTNMKISALGISCGFSGNTAFHIAFRREEGVTPGGYRKKMAGKAQ